LGRNWSSPLGNLYASGLVRLRAGDPPASTLGFVAAIALYDVLSRTAPKAAFQIKWPNDVMANGAKISGILLERAGDAIVVGIGVNLASHPNLPDRQTTSVATLTGAAPQPDAFIPLLVDAFTRVLDQWRTLGLPHILALWQANAHPVGAPLSVTVPDGTRLNGNFQGLSRDGALILRLADGTDRAIHAGDVFQI
jgi:BirA family transcriptional regulator, biotin operon repressor / biotin---[acetyl-CoA-carboxylase] ligase